MVKHDQGATELLFEGKRLHRNDVLFEILKARVPAVTGLSVGPYGVRVHYTAASDEDLATLKTLVAAHHSLEIKTDKLLIKADDKDEATISCPVGYATFRFNVWRRPFPPVLEWDNAPLYASGVEKTESGTAKLELAVAVPGEYLIEVRREDGDFASGFVMVRAESQPLPQPLPVHGEGSKEGSNGKD